MGTFSVGGLASGLDTKSIVDQLMSIEARGKTRLEWNRQLWEARKSIWNDVNFRLNSLQGFANVLSTPSTWGGLPTASSSDPTKLTSTVTGSPAAGTYTFDINQLAAKEVWNAANALPPGSPSVSGVRQSGSFYQSAFTEAGGSTALTSLTDFDGTSLGLDVGSTITLQSSVGGTPQPAQTFTVLAGSTLTDLANWTQSQFPGSTVTVNPDGTVNYKSASGTANEITNLSFTAVDSSSSPLAVFNGTAGASTSQVVAAVDGSGGLSADDVLTFTQGASTWNVAVSQFDGANEIAAKINGTSGIGVTASVVGGKLQLDSNTPGSAGSFAVTSAGTTVGQLGLSETTAGQDAQFTVNGTAYTRGSNTGLTDVVTGLTVNLLDLTSPDVTLTVAAGTAPAGDVKKKVMDFVNKYNEVIDLINSKTGETKNVNPKNLNEFLRGPMARDYTLGSVASDLRRWSTDVIDGLPDGARMLSDIGISTGAFAIGYSKDNTSGRLVVDEAKLDAALAADPQKVRDVFAKIGTDGTSLKDDGIARRVSTLVANWRSGGAVDASLQGATGQITRLQSTIDAFDRRLERKRVYYERIFSTLESQLGKMQSQSNWLSGQLSGLS